MVLFVVDGGSRTIDLVGIACAAEGTFFGSGVVTLAEKIKADGAFSAKSKDVSINGEFVSATRAEGTARALTKDARGCGIGQEAKWISECDLTVIKEKEEAQPGGVVISSSFGTTEGGHSIAHVLVKTRTGTRLTGDLIKSGTCAGS